MRRAIIIGVVLALIVAAAVVFLVLNQDEEAEPGEKSPETIEARCFFAPVSENIALYHAPFNDPTQQKGSLSINVLYPVTATHTGYFYVEVRTDGGWVDRRNGILSGACDALPEDTTPLEGFATLCVFRAAQESMLYADAELTVGKDTVATARTYPVTQRTANAYYLRFDDAFGGWVNAADGQLSGACEGVPFAQPNINTVPDNPAPQTTATLNADSSLLSEPNSQTGAVIVTLPAGSLVSLIAGPATESGASPETVVIWFQVQSEGGEIGWLRQEVLNFNP